MNLRNLFRPKNNKVLYTAIFGDRDDLKPIKREKGIDYVVFTHNPELKSNDFTVVVCPLIDIDPCRNARFYKVNSDFVLKDYEYSAWIDANISWYGSNLGALFDKYLKYHDIAIHSHPKRNCIYDEAEKCIESERDRKELILAQMEKYKAEYYPANYGLVSSSIVFRRHTRAATHFNHQWWNEVLNHSRRDQLSFNYVAWKLGIEYFTIPGHVKNNNVEGFQFYKHVGKSFSKICSVKY